MLKNLFSTFAKKAMYALAAVLIAFLLQSTQAFHPTDPLQVKIWEWIVLPVLVGLVGLLKRLLTWDPGKTRVAEDQSKR